MKSSGLLTYSIITFTKREDLANSGLEAVTQPEGIIPSWDDWKSCSKKNKDTGEQRACVRCYWLIKYGENRSWVGKVSGLGKLKPCICSLYCCMADRLFHEHLQWTLISENFSLKFQISCREAQSPGPESADSDLPTPVLTGWTWAVPVPLCASVSLSVSRKNKVPIAQGCCEE